MINQKKVRIGAKEIRSNHVLQSERNQRPSDDERGLASFSYNQIPSHTNTHNLKNAKKLDVEDGQIETRIDMLSSNLLDGDYDQTLEEMYDQTILRGINEEEVSARRPYRFTREDTWNGACRKDVIRRLRNRPRAGDFGGHGVSVGCCYPCFKPLDEQIIEEMS